MRLIAGLIIVILFSGCQSAGGYGSAAQQDTEWAWDLERGRYEVLLWVCRGIQTGKSADSSLCANKVMEDTQWPGYKKFW